MAILRYYLILMYIDYTCLVPTSNNLQPELIPRVIMQLINNLIPSKSVPTRPISIYNQFPSDLIRTK